MVKASLVYKRRWPWLIVAAAVAHVCLATAVGAWAGVHAWNLLLWAGLAGAVVFAAGLVVPVGTNRRRLLAGSGRRCRRGLSRTHHGASFRSAENGELVIEKRTAQDAGIPMDDEGSEPLLLRRYRAWLAPRQESAYGLARRPFFTDGLVVLDTNVLLDLYRYTQRARLQVLTALRLVADQHRLWLPHQVGLEFVRNRANAVRGRQISLSNAGKAVSADFQEAVRLVIEARDTVAGLVSDIAQDDSAADELTTLITRDQITTAFSDWQKMLTDHIKRLRDTEDITPQSVVANDPVLPEIASLFGARIGDPLPEATIRQLVSDAVTYRFPNRIPPGFEDRGKATDLGAAGDYLLWEEIIGYVGDLPEPRYVLIVSRDTKRDWYEHDDKGSPTRPWPALHDEMRARAGGELLILTPKEFFEGAQEFLGAQLAADTYEEFDRLSEEAAADPASDVDEDGLTITDLTADRITPGPLAEEARKAAGLVTQESLALLKSDRRFAWWLIAVTADLRVRNAAYDEPPVALVAASRIRPADTWRPERVPLAGGVVKVWVAPWMAEALRVIQIPDLGKVRRLIGTALQLSDG